MYASVRRYQVRSGRIDALMHRIDEEFAPALSQEPGFVSYLAIDTGDGTIETVSVFRDRAAAVRSNQLAADYVRDNLGEFKMRITGVDGGQVVVGRWTLQALDAAHVWRAGRSRLRSASNGNDAYRRPVLVVGATGRTGRLIVERLQEQGITVHALVRDQGRGRRLLPPGVRLFVGDVLRTQTLAAPMVGVGSVIVASCGSAEPGNTAELVDYFGTINLVRHAAASNIGRFVFVSSIYATRPAQYLDVDPASLGWKAKAEEVIRRSGVPYSIIRPGWLTDGGDGESLTVSQGDTVEGRISRVALASVCTEVLSLPAAHGKTIDVVAAPAESTPSVEAAVAALTPDARPHRARRVVNDSSSSPGEIARPPVGNHARWDPRLGSLAADDGARKLASGVGVRITSCPVAHSDLPARQPAAGHDPHQ